MKGTRPRITRQQQFEYAYIFGAVCPAQDKAIGLMLPYANTKSMILYLKEVSKNIPSGRHAVIVLDQAAWHTTSKIGRFDKLTLIALPAASPELNPVEQVWQQLRDNWLANRCYESYDAIVDACCHAWNWFINVPHKVRQLCSRSWAKV